VAGKKNPAFAVRLATGVSEQDQADFARIAEERGVTIAVVVRWACIEYLRRERRERRRQEQERCDESA
jgi:hypothetical protein